MTLIINLVINENNQRILENRRNNYICAVYKYLQTQNMLKIKGAFIKDNKLTINIVVQIIF